MPTGTVKWFNPSKGFGFIQPDDKSKDVFVHISAVERAGLGNLNENQKIAYELEQGQNGKTRLRARTRTERQDLRSRFESGLTAPRPSFGDP